VSQGYTFTGLIFVETSLETCSKESQFKSQSVKSIQSKPSVKTVTRTGFEPGMLLPAGPVRPDLTQDREELRHTKGFPYLGLVKGSILTHRLWWGSNPLEQRRRGLFDRGQIHHPKKVKKLKSLSLEPGM
jgi:hypothetical protein